MIKGRIDAPAAVGEYPCTWIRFKGNKKKKIPIAAYKGSVSKFSPVKVRDRNSESGSIGDTTLPSVMTKAMRHPIPTVKLPITTKFDQPKLADSMIPTTRPPSPTVARNAPHQSSRPAL